MKYRYLFSQMFRRELRQKYKGSVLGVLWYFVNPLVLMGAYTLVFSVMLKAFGGIPNYPLFLLIGLVVWVFFSQALLSSAPSLVIQAQLVRKVRFPRELIPGSVVSVQLVTFLVMLAILTPVALIIRDSLDPALLLLPLIVAALFALSLGLGLLTSSLHAYYRDVEPVLAAALLPWFFLTPIFFRIEDLPGAETHPWIADLLRWANPVAPFIEATRDVLFLGRAPGLDVIGYVVGVGALALLAGRAVFRRLDPELAVVL